MNSEFLDGNSRSKYILFWFNQHRNNNYGKFKQLNKMFSLFRG